MVILLLITAQVSFFLFFLSHSSSLFCFFVFFFSCCISLWNVVQMFYRHSFGVFLSFSFLVLGLLHCVGGAGGGVLLGVGGSGFANISLSMYFLELA